MNNYNRSGRTMANPSNSCTGIYPRGTQRGFDSYASLVSIRTYQIRTYSTLPFSSLAKHDGILTTTTTGHIRRDGLQPTDHGVSPTSTSRANRQLLSTPSRIRWTGGHPVDPDANADAQSEQCNLCPTARSCRSKCILWKRWTWTRPHQRQYFCRTTRLRRKPANPGESPRGRYGRESWSEIYSAELGRHFGQDWNECEIQIFKSQIRTKIWII